jgi:hypothetical protein
MSLVINNICNNTQYDSHYNPDTCNDSLDNTNDNTNDNIYKSILDNNLFTYPTQNSMLLIKLIKFYEKCTNINKLAAVIQGTSRITLRIIDWFVTNYSKGCYTVYNIKGRSNNRFKVYVEYKLQLKAYSKKRFDPFCRWDRLCFPYKNNNFIETTIGQLNFFKWAIENDILQYIENNFDCIEQDMIKRNSLTRKKENIIKYTNSINNKTRKIREELSISATKTIKKETVEITIEFK